MPESCICWFNVNLIQVLQRLIQPFGIPMKSWHSINTNDPLKSARPLSEFARNPSCFMFTKSCRANSPLKACTCWYPHHKERWSFYCSAAEVMAKGANVKSKCLCRDGVWRFKMFDTWHARWVCCLTASHNGHLFPSRSLAFLWRKFKWPFSQELMVEFQVMTFLNWQSLRLRQQVSILIFTILQAQSLEG